MTKLLTETEEALIESSDSLFEIDLTQDLKAAILVAAGKTEMNLETVEVCLIVATVMSKLMSLGIETNKSPEFVFATSGKVISSLLKIKKEVLNNK